MISGRLQSIRRHRIEDAACPVLAIVIADIDLSAKHRLNADKFSAALGRLQGLFPI